MSKVSRITSLFLAFAVFALVSLPAVPGMGADAQHPHLQSWLPPTEEIVFPVPLPSVVYTKIPKPTADMSNFTREYTIDLKRFNIHNEGKHPVETSKGINAALQYAKKAGKNKIIFPKGTYLISEQDPVIFNHKNTIVDLNGATIQINTNGLKGYGIVKIVEGAENFRLTNGTIRGDKDTHDYKAGGEWGHALVCAGGRNLEIDHLTLTYAMGDGVTTQNGAQTESAPFHRIYIYPKHLEQGGFSERGVKAKSTEKTRTIKPFDITTHAGEGEMEVGYIAGYLGFPHVIDRNYQAYFYNKGMRFIEKIDLLQYKKLTIPKGSIYVHLEFNQSEVKSNIFCNFITNLKPPRDVYFHHNHCLGNRRLGMGFCGGQKWIIEDNLFEANGGAAPGFGVDFEDGWLLMQDVVFRRNSFKNNIRGDLVVCGGSELLFEDNDLEKGASFWPAALSYTFRNNRVTGGSVAFGTRTGQVELTGNHFENCTMSITYDGRGFNDGFPRKVGVPVPTPAITFEDSTLVNIKAISGTYFNFEKCKIKNSRFFTGKDTALVRFKRCLLDNASVSYAAAGPEVNVVVENCKGKPNDYGANLKRRVSRPYADIRTSYSADPKEVGEKKGKKALLHSGG